jgi:predicted Rossmann fold flavoprotein
MSGNSYGKNKVVIIGGGAAGFFAAVNISEFSPSSEIIILEKSDKVLSKVRISGGGRCNVTNKISEPRELIKFYPRGSKELLPLFYKFSSKDTIDWFQSRGVELKIEEDGRIFPVSDNSAEIVNALADAAKRNGVNVITKAAVKSFVPLPGKRWKVNYNEEEIIADRLLLSPGSSNSIWRMLQQLGHSIVEPVPSLFTFHVPDERLNDLAGISVNDAEIKISGTSLKERGPVLITHWGLSGPAVLKLSAFGARKLNSLNYNFEISINWNSNFNFDKVKNDLEKLRKKFPSKNILSIPLFNLPARLFERIFTHAGIKEKIKWNDLSNKNLLLLAGEITDGKFTVTGKSTFKEEFVTAGGVNLKEVNFRTMESKLFPNLFFSGEVLDIDAVTGGFNFQAAWTTAFIAAKSMQMNAENSAP